MKKGCCNDALDPRTCLRDDRTAAGFRVIGIGRVARTADTAGASVGGPTDTLGRQLAQRLQTALGQSVVVDNRAGANSAIGSDIVAKSPADGYTLLFNASIFAINPHLVALPYDIHRDFTPIALIAKAPPLIAVNRDLPVKDVRELLAYARANPGKLNFGIGSNGSAGHLAPTRRNR